MKNKDSPPLDFLLIFHPIDSSFSVFTTPWIFGFFLRKK